MKTKFTPGPWVFRTELGTVNAIDPMHSQDGRARIEICDPSNGQTWNGGALPIDEREANASLIAAAPDLFAALQELEAEFRKVFPVYYYAEPWAHDTNKALKQAQEALTKALGHD